MRRHRKEEQSPSQLSQKIAREAKKNEEEEWKKQHDRLIEEMKSEIKSLNGKLLQSKVDLNEADRNRDILRRFYKTNINYRDGT